MDAPDAARRIGREKGHPMRVPITVSLAKTASFAVMHFSVAFGIAWLLTGSVAVAGAIALIEPLANTVAYFFHERLWARLGTPALAGRHC